MSNKHNKPYNKPYNNGGKLTSGNTQRPITSDAPSTPQPVHDAPSTPVNDTPSTPQPFTGETRVPVSPIQVSNPPQNEQQKVNMPTSSKRKAVRNVYLREGATRNSDHKLIVEAGTIIDVLEETNASWIKVRLENGEIGYLMSLYTKVV